MKLKFILLLFLYSILQNTSAQNYIPAKHYDSLWNETTKDSAFFVTRYEEAGENIQATNYWLKSGKIYSISYYEDTSFRTQVGLYRKYYETGQVEDSSYYNDDGKMITSYYYYPGGKLWVKYSYDPQTDKEITNAFDIDGKQLNDFIYFREADFPGGNSAWQTFLAENIKTKVPIKRGAPNGSYQVIVRFIIDTKGKVTDIKPETGLGFGMEDEVIRVIKKSPKWEPALWLNKPVNAYRRQPLTFVVSDE